MDSRPKLLVALGLEGHDAPTVRYASKLCEWLEASTITFVHVLRRYELDHAPYRVFPDLRRSILDAAGNQCRALVEERGSIPKDTEVRYEVLEGSPAIEVARAASQTIAPIRSGLTIRAMTKSCSGARIDAIGAAAQAHSGG